MRVAALALQKMAKNRDIGIDRVEQPEVGDVGGGEIGQALVFLPAAAGELRALGGEDLKDAVDQAAHIVVGADLEQGGNKAGFEPEGAGLRLLHVGDAQGGTAFAGLVAASRRRFLRAIWIGFSPVPVFSSMTDVISAR